jgi:hypothetical protein
MPTVKNPLKHVPNWRRGAVLAGLFTTVVGGFVAVVLFAWILLDVGNPASNKTTFRAAESWTEIKNDVRQMEDPTVAERLTGAVRTTSERMSAPGFPVPGSVPIIGSLVRSAQTATHRPILGFPAPEGPSNRTSAANAEAVQAVGLGETPLVPALVSTPKNQPQPTPLVTSATTEMAETSARARTEAVATFTSGSDAPATTATSAARSSSSDARMGRKEGSAKRQAKAALLEPERRDARAQRPRSRARQALSAKPRLAGATPAQEESPALPASAASPQAPPDRERMHLLGVPLPTGSEIKACLLALRC